MEFSVVSSPVSGPSLAFALGLQALSAYPVLWCPASPGAPRQSPFQDGATAAPSVGLLHGGTASQRQHHSCPPTLSLSRLVARALLFGHQATPSSSASIDMRDTAFQGPPETPSQASGKRAGLFLCGAGQHPSNPPALPKKPSLSLSLRLKHWALG